MPAFIKFKRILMSFINLRNRYLAGKIHFIGIGGIGMSAVAAILKRIGCDVCGSDLSTNTNTKNLEHAGIKCSVGHKEENINQDIVLVVETSIVKPNNPEILKAKSLNIPIIRRADMLAQIMKEKLGITVAGTHGKTSTTAMIAVLLESAGLDPTVINGGIINYFSSNSKFGEGKFLVAESDESDGSFVDLPSFIGVVNNIEPEHMEFYGGDFEMVKSYYQKYINQIPANGLAALCIDDLEVKKIYDSIGTKSNIVSLSIQDPNADFFGFNISFDIYGLQFCVRIKKTGHVIEGIRMPIYGIHNVKNALAPVSIGIFLGLSEEQIKQGLSKYSGVKRRFSKVGEFGGITIIDDYGHHPTEIKAVFKAAKEILPAGHKLIVVFQPHKYSRTRDLFTEFCNAFFDVDVVVIADIYSAGQEPIVGINQDSLIAGIKNAGHKNVIKLTSESDLPNIIQQQAKSGDMVICIGAGSISDWANDLPEKLKKIL